MNEQTIFGIGTALLALGAVAFLVMGRSEPAEKQHHYVAAFFIAATAAASYLAMTMGQGHINVQDVTGPREFYYARYLDWSITTPLLLLSLGLLALTHLHERGTLLAGAIGADIFMIVTGLFAGLSAGFAKWMWFTVSCGAFLAVLVLIWGALRNEADKQPRGYASLYGKMTGLLTAFVVRLPGRFPDRNRGFAHDHAQPRNADLHGFGRDGQNRLQLHLAGRLPSFARARRRTGRAPRRAQRNGREQANRARR